MTNQPSPSFEAIRNRRYRARQQKGLRVVPVEVSAEHIRALTANGLINSTNPNPGFGIKLLLTLFTKGMVTIDNAKFAAIAQTAGIAAPAQHASPPPA